MPKRTDSFVPVILVILLAVASTSRASFAQDATDNCVTKPGAEALPGSHWYFHFDRANHRQCWYLGPDGAVAEAVVQPSPMRLPALEPTRQATVAPASLAGADEPAAQPFALRWPDALGSLRSPAEFASMSMSNSQTNSARASDGYAEVPATTGVQNDLPLTWPVPPPADRTLARMAAENSVALDLLAIFVGALGFSALLIRANSRRSAARRITQSSFREWRPLSESRSPLGEKAPSASVDLDAVARPNDLATDLAPNFEAELMLLLEKAETE
jgi:hypothetical protein